MSNLWNRLKNRIEDAVRSRTFVVIVAFCILSAILLQRVFYLQVVRGQDYADQYELQIQKTKEIEGTRGNIYDRNGKLLAYNELAYSVTIEDNGVYDSTSEKNEELNQVINTVIDVVERNGDTVINDFGIILDSNDQFIFVAESDTQRLRFIADVYGEATIDSLTDEQRNQSAADIIDYLCTNRTYGYGIDQDEISKEDVLKLVNVRYAISLNSYQKYIATTISEDVSDETVADISENLDTLQGVSVEEESLRRYADAEAFANIIGYTGQISTEEYDALSNDEKELYDMTDTIGKAGIEQIMDSALKGKKGEQKLYVNNVGRVIDTVQETDAEAGNDLYLTIDADLQVAAYNILEQELAGILVSHLQNILDFDRSTIDNGTPPVAVGDVYHAFINNDMLDMTHFEAEDAGDMEKEVFATFSAYKEELLQNINTILLDADSTAYKDQTKEIQAYLSYIVNTMLTSNTGILDSSAIDTNDETYIAWRQDETININTYLNYAISQNWLDTSKLSDYTDSEGQYTDASELYNSLTSYIIEYLSSNNAFDKLIYRYMIKSGALTGRQMCLLLYEQNILPYDEAQYNGLLSGSIGAYDFVRGKIETLDITPGQLGLEPCTGSFVMTDTDTGDVIACVSYPGYDNNRLANTMDSSYYNKLVTNQAHPLYNNATQEKTAPGSTFKPLSAVAGLTEGVIDTSTVVYCSGTYEKVEPHLNCWLYPAAHGGLNVSTAISNSCNIFFSEVGYRLSLKDNGISAVSEDNNTGDATETYYSSELGLDALAKYAKLFGLGDTSGIEVPESEPEISDENSVPSAIGQGSNNFTTTQLARYVAAIANKGTVYDLTLFDKVTSVDGDIIEEYEPEVKSTITDVSSSTWDAVHTGMRDVVRVAYSNVFTDLNSAGLTFSGKSGTAQQSASHADHALFVGYAPSDDPEVSFAIRIANGYTSTYAAEVGRDIMKYYYEYAPAEEIITGNASTIDTNASNND